MSAKIPKWLFQFWTFLHANAVFSNSEFFCYVGITIRIKWIFALVNWSQSAPFKVQDLNNQIFPCSVKCVSIMRRSSRKCPVVTDHEKLIATLSQKDRALRGAWDILNGVVKGPTQAEQKWVIPKNHIAYYLKKLKEEGVCIEMEVNAPKPGESTPRRQEDVNVDPWDLYVQAYQWAGQEVSKGKLSSRKAASEVYL